MVGLDTPGHVVGPAGTDAGGGGPLGTREGQELGQGREGDVAGDQ